MTDFRDDSRARAQLIEMLWNQLALMRSDSNRFRAAVDDMQSTKQRLQIESRELIAKIPRPRGCQIGGRRRQAN